MFFFNCMKKSLLYILCLVLLAGACMQDQTNPMIVGTCFDGIKNQDEKAIDCGGKCLSCYEDSKAPCAATLKTNVFTTPYNTWTLKSADYYSELYSGAYKFDITLPSYGGLTITLSESKIPTQDKTYRITRDNAPATGYATVSLYHSVSGFTYRAESGNVYVTVRNGKVAAELCSLPLTSIYYGQINTLTLSGRIVSK